MGALLRGLARHAPLVLGGSIFIGILLPDLAAALHPALAPLAALQLFFSLLRLDWRPLGRWLRQPGAALWALSWQLGLGPLIAWGGVLLLGLPPALAQALVLNAAAPTLTGGAALAQVVGLDDALVVLLIVASTLLLPMTLPPALFWLLGIELTIDWGSFLLRALLLIGLPFALAGLLRWIFGPPREAQSEILGGLIVVLLVLAGIAVMAGVSQRLLSNPAQVAWVLLLAIGFNALFQVLGAAAFWRRGRRSSLSFALAFGNRNMVLMLVLTGGLLGPDFALYVAISQIPMYLVPLVMAPLYRRLL